MAHFLRAFRGCISGLVLCVSCGGAVSSGDTSTIDGGSGGASGATGGVGGSGVGGSTGTAGTGTLPDVCKLPSETGPCDALFRVYWHNPATGTCEPFVYGGCEGNENRFETLAACQAACHGGAPDFDACTGATDCTVMPVACCGGCEPVTRETYVAINRLHIPDYSTTKGCNTGNCGACQDVSPIDRTSQYFVATCLSGQCAVVDIRETELVACNGDGDCRLRVGAECCERCSSDTLVALSTSANLGDLVCGNDAPACPPCEPMIPSGFRATCNTGKCTVTTLR